MPDIFHDVFFSITSLSVEERIKIAHNATGSRVYDVLLESPTVPPKAKRQFVMDLIGHYHLLVDDRIGSRVGDRCWAYADTYLKASTLQYRNDEHNQLPVYSRKKSLVRWSHMNNFLPAHSTESSLPEISTFTCYSGNQMIGGICRQIVDGFKTKPTPRLPILRLPN